MVPQLDGLRLQCISNDVAPREPDKTACLARNKFSLRHVEDGLQIFERKLLGLLYKEVDQDPCDKGQATEESKKPRRFECPEDAT